jgi:hypothetical protein
VTGYVVDDSALVVGLSSAGTGQERREFSRLIAGAYSGGPGLDVPAMCLIEAAKWRGEIVEHVADLVMGCPAGAIDVHGLERDRGLEGMDTTRRRLGWPTTHAILVALTTGQRIISAEPERYQGTGVDAIAL